MASCNIQKSEVMYIGTQTINGSNTSWTVTTYDGEYISMDFKKSTSAGGWFTSKSIEKMTPGNMKSQSIFVADASGESIKFNSEVEFMNFMSKRGYDMINQEMNSHKDVINYTFKK